MGGQKIQHLRKSIRKILHSFKVVQTWQLLLIFIPLAFFTATLLRFDHLKMTELRAAVIAADEAEDDEEIVKTLEALKKFVFTHIVVNVEEKNGEQTLSFGTGPFYLEHTYRRAANKAIENSESTIINDSNPNGNIYEAVRRICQPKAIANGWAWTSPGYIECWTTELAKYPTSDTLDPNIITADVPSTELYRHNYASPAWAPTFAGFMLIICFVLLVVIIIRFLIWFIMRAALVFVKG